MSPLLSQTPSRILQIAMISFVSLYEAAKIFLVNRVGHRRLLLAFCFYANFLNQFIFGEDKGGAVLLEITSLLPGLIGTYTLLYPFEWSPSEYANYKSARPIIRKTVPLLQFILFRGRRDDSGHPPSEEALPSEGHDHDVDGNIQSGEFRLDHRIGPGLPIFLISRTVSRNRGRSSRVWCPAASTASSTLWRTPSWPVSSIQMRLEYGIEKMSRPDDVGGG